MRAVTPLGWEIGIPKCAKTPHEKNLNHYQETAECGLSKKNWTLVVQAEGGTLGLSCVGPNDQSFLINAPKSPVTIRWIPHNTDAGKGWTVNLKVNTASKLACSNQYTFFGFMNDIEHGGGPLPNLTRLRSSHELSYEQFAENGGEARLTLGAQIFWNGKAHILEVLPARIGYKTNPGFPPGVIQKINTNKFEYVIIDDSWSTHVYPNGRTQNINLNWTTLFSKAIQLGLFTKPNGETATQAVYVAVETHNQAIGNLYQSKFTVSSD
ncbi:hypothetical protein [Novosphingobium pentaromativorans]|uniref:hypothetical protein n=1 Tax=Novosphingobium pentaromativorans TaxID=205844 RepID=UPI00136214DA|nr:hypothetical protein [Novosphingobium pentaromativorans]